MYKCKNFNFSKFFSPPKMSFRPNFGFRRGTSHVLKDTIR